MPVTSRDFLVDRADLRRTRLDATPLPEPGDGAALLRVDKFAFTANNITYAVFGDAMAYWQFFPGPAGFGRIPVWGFAEVIESRHDAIRRGERVYGYLPMSTHLVVQPARVAEGSFMDGSPHRAQLPAAYQLYRRVGADSALAEDQRALLHPLFMTSFLIDDFLADNAMFGAGSIVIASASSKTALGLGFLLRARGVPAVGLTSARNRAFCERVGYYDRVLAYDELAQLPAGVPTVFVDMAGDGTLLHAVHHHFRDQLRHSCIVGATHWEQRGTQHALPGAKPQFFFAPNQIKKRQHDWGAGGLEPRFAAAWAPFQASLGAWLEVSHGRGDAEIERVYREVLEGRSAPQAGHVLTPT